MAAQMWASTATISTRRTIHSSHPRPKKGAPPVPSPQAELHYEGSITIDTELLTAAGILPFERVQVVDIANGTRFETYAIEGRAGSRTVCVNGAAARLVQVGDPIIVISYAQMTRDEAARHHPTIVLLNADNSIRETLAGDRTTPIEILSESL